MYWIKNLNLIQSPFFCVEYYYHAGVDAPPSCAPLWAPRPLPPPSPVRTAPTGVLQTACYPGPPQWRWLWSWQCWRWRWCRWWSRAWAWGAAPSSSCPPWPALRPCGAGVVREERERGREAAPSDPAGTLASSPWPLWAWRRWRCWRWRLACRLALYQCQKRHIRIQISGPPLVCYRAPDGSGSRHSSVIVCVSCHVC